MQHPAVKNPPNMYSCSRQHWLDTVHATIDPFRAYSHWAIAIAIVTSLEMGDMVLYGTIHL